MHTSDYTTPALLIETKQWFEEGLIATSISCSFSPVNCPLPLLLYTSGQILHWESHSDMPLAIHILSCILTDALYSPKGTSIWGYCGSQMLLLPCSFFHRVTPCRAVKNTLPAPVSHHGARQKELKWCCLNIVISDASFRSILCP